MTDWLDGDEDLVGSQYPFSAMATVDLIRGNLEVCYEQSGWALQVGLHDEVVAAQTCTAASTWYVIADFGEIPVLARRGKAGWRPLKISAEILSDDAAESLVRIYAFPGYYGPATPNPTTGYGRGYAELTTSASAYARKTATLAAADVEAAVQMLGAPAADSAAPATATARVVLVALALSKSAGDVIRMRSLHIEEVVP
jgi:hypothetical protein